MPTLDQYLNGWKDDFYAVEIHLRQAQPRLWIARAQVSRNDTGEVVGGKQCLNESRDGALTSLTKDLDVYISDFTRPPPEWGQTNLRILLSDFKKFDCKLTTALAQMEKSRRAGVLSESNLHATFRINVDLIIENSVNFSHRLHELTEDERIQLVTSPEDVYKDKTNPWNLDDLQSRSDIFKLIANPSDEVIKAHEAHEARRLET